MSHLQSLHSNEPLNSHQEAIISELTRLEDATTQSHALDYLTTELNIRTGAHPDKLQHGGQKPTETSVTEFCYKSVNLLLEELMNSKVILFLILELFR